MGIANEQSQTTTFRDGSSQWEVAMDAVSDSTRHVTPSDDVALGDFMSRPIVISSSTWTPGITPYSLTINPWSLFFSNKRNINRINNYQILNSKLKIKITLNGNPFYYGRLMVDYHPLPSYDAVTPLGTTTTAFNVGASQRLHCFLDPTTSQGALMELPFIWPNNGVNIQSSEFTLLGNLNIRELASLKHANGSVTPITITIFAWAEDLTLSIPTTVNSTSIVAQASEVDMKPSAIMSGVAMAAKALKSVPVIGPYALATSMVMSSLGSMARLFGYSRPAVVTEASAMRQANVGELAVVDKKENIQRLIADSRQELTIDPSVIGVKLPDELSVPYIAGKESWLTSFPWTTTRVYGDNLLSIRVNPRIAQAIANVYYMPACCFASLPFKYWRGTLKYRFQIVCSAYHKGRLMFVYDPNYVSALEPNVSYTRIIDLENERDFTIDVAWGQPKPFLPMSTTILTSTSLTPYATVDANSNGVLGVYVLNDLTTPNSTINNDISIQVFISACDDIDFAEPNATNIASAAYVTQSGEVTMEEAEDAPTNMVSKECMAQCLPDDNTHLVFFGETFRSFRALLKRYSLQTVTSTGAPAAVGAYQWQQIYPDFPCSRGTVGSGGMNAAGLANYSVTTLLTYLAPAFLASRGSIRYKHILREDTPGNGAMLVTRGYGNGPYGNALLARVDTTVDLTSRFYIRTTLLTNTFNASAVTSTGVQPCIEYELPYYQPYRFSVAKDPFARATLQTFNPLDNRHSVLSDLKFNATTDRVIADRYVSVGEDFQLLLFQGAPPMYYYTIP